MLEALADLCSNCVNAVEVPDGVVVLWHALQKILRGDARTDALAAASGPRTWPAYAKALEQAARRDDAEVRRLLKPVLDHVELGAQGWQALRAWTAVDERSDKALAAYRAAAPSASATASVTAACDTVAADRAVHEESRALGAMIGAGYGYGYGRPSMELWAMVRGAWTMAREQGSDAGGALDFASAVVTREWGKTRVRDVSALPLPAMTCAVGRASPASWADAEFHHQWHAFVQRWCARLEAELAAASKGSHKQQLLLVCDWPLTSPDDRDLAFLAQYEQIGPRVPWGGSGQRYDPYDDRAGPGTRSSWSSPSSPPSARSPTLRVSGAACWPAHRWTRTTSRLSAGRRSLPRPYPVRPAPCCGPPTRCWMRTWPGTAAARGRRSRSARPEPFCVPGAAPNRRCIGRRSVRKTLAGGGSSPSRRVSGSGCRTTRRVARPARSCGS